MPKRHINDISTRFWELGSLVVLPLGVVFLILFASSGATPKLITKIIGP